MKRTLLIALLLASVALAGCTFQNLTNRAPEAVIDVSPREGTAPLTVHFDARFSRDDGAITEYYWDFGDPYDAAPLACSSTAMHTYQHPDTYLVKLTVIDSEGEVDSEKLAIVVQNPPPVASFEVSNDMPPFGVRVLFDASASYDSNGEIVSYSWNFGDGTTGSGVETSHVYGDGSYYVVTLTVKDNEGATETAKQPIMPQAGGGDCGGGSCSGGNDKPLAVISGLPGCAGAKVGTPITFDGSYSRAAEGKIIRYKWDFGDGNTATGAKIDHAYQQTGLFTVVLTVNDDSGNQARATGSLRVYD